MGFDLPLIQQHDDGEVRLIRWSAKYDPQSAVSESIISGAPARLLERLDEDRDALIEEILQG